MRNFSKEDKIKIYKACGSKSVLEVGYDWNLDKYLTNPRSIRNKINGIYLEVRNNPEIFKVSEEVMKMVELARSERTSAKRTDIQTVSEKNSVLEEKDIKELVSSASKKSWILLHKKLDDLLKHPRLLRKQQLAPLAIMSGMTFDKGRLVMGESTENIAMKSKIDKDLGSKELLDILLKAKENNETRE